MNMLLAWFDFVDGGRGVELSASQQCFAAGKYLPMSGFKWPESSLKSRPAVDSEPVKPKATVTDTDSYSDINMHED